MLFNKFETKQELYDFILSNQMSYTRMLKSYDGILHESIKSSFPNVKNMGESYWLYINDRSAPSKCMCGTNLSFANICKGYTSTQCKSCYEKNRIINSSVETSKRTQSIYPPYCSNPHCIKDTITGLPKPVMKNKNGLWSEFCSKLCIGQGNSLLSRSKSKNTMMKNHGVENALQSDKILQKMYESNIEKYGVDNVMKLSVIAGKPPITKMELYGVPSAWSGVNQYQIFVDKTSASHGYAPGLFTNVSQIPEIHQKKMKSEYLAKGYITPSGKELRIQGYEDKFLDRALTYYPETMFNFDSKHFVQYTLNEKLHTYHPDFVLEELSEVVEVKSTYTFYADLIKNIAKAQAYVDKGYALSFAIYSEKNISSYITFSQNKSRIDNQLSAANVQYETLVQFDNYIVDYYIKDQNIALCYRSVNFTNDTFMQPNHYLDMYLYFENKGIQLLTVNDLELSDVWLKSMISKMNTASTSVYARHTHCKLLDKTPVIFLNNNHIQGYAPVSIDYGLFHNDELIGVMCFNKFRKGSGKDRGDNSYELVRYATSHRIIGGASKLLKHFIKDYNPLIIYSYSDNSISNGNMYKALGFVHTHTNPPDYQYNSLADNSLHSRFKYRKGALKDKGLEYYDEFESESTIMKKNNYRRVYGSGRKTWIFS